MGGYRFPGPRSSASSPSSVIASEDPYKAKASRREPQYEESADQYSRANAGQAAPSYRQPQAYAASQPASSSYRQPASSAESQNYAPSRTAGRQTVQSVSEGRRKANHDFGMGESLIACSLSPDPLSPFFICSLSLSSLVPSLGIKTTVRLRTKQQRQLEGRAPAQHRRLL